LHKYLYTHADPVNGIDPSGKFVLVGGIMGALAGRYLVSGMKTTATMGTLARIGVALVKWGVPVVGFVTGIALFSCSYTLRLGASPLWDKSILSEFPTHDKNISISDWEKNIEHYLVECINKSSLDEGKKLKAIQEAQIIVKNMFHLSKSVQ
jgi:hypothetical protein